MSIDTLNIEPLGNRPSTNPAVQKGYEALDKRKQRIRTNAQKAVLVGGLAMNEQTEGRDRYNAFMRNIGNEFTDRREREEVQALLHSTFGVTEDENGKRTGTSLDKLPELDSSIMMRSGAEAQIYVNGKVEVISGGNEVVRMQEIQQRLAHTLALIDVNNTNTRQDIDALVEKYPNGSAYVVPCGNRLILARDTLGGDLRWLSSGYRIPNSPGSPQRYTPQEGDEEGIIQKRERMFRQYRNMLTHIKNNLTTPALEHQYITRNGSDDENQRCLEQYCRDPNAVAGAGKFALLLAVGALLALWSIKDIKAGTISFGTLLLAGAAMFLMQNGPKNQFMTSSQFADLSQHIGKDGLEKIDRMKPSARNHLIAFLKSPTARNNGITRENMHLLTEPKATNGRIIDSKRVPEEIAQLFIGYKGTAGAAYVIENSHKVRDPQGKEIEYALADAHKHSDIGKGELKDAVSQGPPPAATPQAAG